MALIRITGANTGICDYLRYGKKQGRNLTRNELDLRVALDGNLELTEQIIESIKDADQDRYLHITISFRESEIPIEKMEDIVRDYKELLMHAYGEEEYNFYAEAHLPKIKHSVNLKSGKKVERKPHIHIVIPKKNLLSDQVLDPIRLYKTNTRYFEAIQEHINAKYNLESPKEYRRNVGINTKEIVLSRVNLQEFRGSNKELKVSIANSIIKEDIRSQEELGKYLAARFDEVIVRNSGTSQEYFAIKNRSDKKYTNLKGAVFSDDFIELRLRASESGHDILPAQRINKLVEEWKTRVSKEIKYISPASSKLRAKYNVASVEGKKELIKYREERFYENVRWSSDRRQATIKRGIKDGQRRDIAGTTFGVSEMQICDMVPNFTGYEYREQGAREDISGKAGQSKHLLRKVPAVNMADRKSEEHQYNGLRRGTRDRSVEAEEPHTTSKKNNTSKSSVVNSIESFHLDRSCKIQEEEKQEFKEIKLKLSGDMLLSSLEATHGLAISGYSTFKAKDGSDRISDGKQNLNVSDFLTKKMHFTWSEAKEYLRDCFDAREKNLNFEAKKEYFLGRASLREYFADLKAERSFLRNECKQKRIDSWNQYKEDRSQIFGTKLSYREKQSELSQAIFRRLQREERIRQYQGGVSSNIAQKEQLTHGEIKELLNIKSEIKKSQLPLKAGNEIWRLSDATSPNRTMEYCDKLRDLEREYIISNRQKLELNDLTPEKNSQGFTEYRTDAKDLIFTDKVSRIEFSIFGDKAKIAVGLELAAAKFNNTLQLKGLASFKQKVLEIAVEKNMAIEFVPQSLQECFEKLKRGEKISENYILSDDMQEQKSASQSNQQERTTSKQPETMAFDR